MQAPPQGEHADAVEDESETDEQRERREADVRIGDDHDAGEQLHRSGEDVPAAVLIHFEGGDHAKHADRNQPDPDQQRDRRDPSDRVADEQDADDRREHAEQRERSAAPGAVHQRGSQLEDPVKEQEDARDHRQRGQAVARLDQDDDSRRDAEHPDECKQPPPSGGHAHVGS